MDNTTNEPTIIKATKATEEEKAWLAYQQKVMEETPQRLEEVAKFLSGIFSIVLTIFLIGNSKLIEELPSFVTAYVSIAWLLSLMMVLFVVFPQKYRLNDTSAASIEASHQKVVAWKYRFLVGAALAFLSGFVALVFGVLLGG